MAATDAFSIVHSLYAFTEPLQIIVVTLNPIGSVDGQAKTFLSWIYYSTLFPIIIGYGGQKKTKEDF